MAENVKKFRMGELFCGGGGLALGAITATTADPEYKIVHKWATDYDINACTTYRKNICPDNEESVICGDVKTLDIGSLGDIDAFVFGFPCNDFSSAGGQKGLGGNFGGLYIYGVKVLERYKPLWFLAENVAGLRSANKGEAFTRIKNDLINAGYRIYPHLYKFEEYGVPQARHRIIIVGIREDLPYKFKIPSPVPYMNIDVSCKTALEVPPIPIDAANNERAKQSEQVTERLKHIKPGQNAFIAELPENLKLKRKSTKYARMAYRRLDPDKPAYTVLADSGGGMYVYHYSEPRALTNREKARLQTFPDNYVFYGSKRAVLRQIGMAVPPKGARIIFEAILKTFARIPYESIELTKI